MSSRRNVDPKDGATLAEDVISTIEPQTKLGRTLAALRAEIIASGMPLLDDSALAREIAERRGGYYRGDRDE